MSSFEYRKKPVVIEAWQFTAASDATTAYPMWLMEGLAEGKVTPGGEVLYINTLEGTMTAVENDWIIRGVKGELYPCKPDIFAATYDKV